LKPKLDVGNNQDLIVFIQGRTISGASGTECTEQFRKPPTTIGITIKNENNV
jgi:hypothetical protein